MDTIETITRSILNILPAICAAFLCVRLCTGCAYLKEFKKEAKPAIVLSLKDAYALGGATAVSNQDRATGISHLKLEMVEVRGVEHESAFRK